MRQQSSCAGAALSTSGTSLTSAPEHFAGPAEAVRTAGSSQRGGKVSGDGVSHLLTRPFARNHQTRAERLITTVALPARE
jgi:hypothetical protein